MNYFRAQTALEFIFSALHAPFRRGQTSLEFLFSVGMVILIFAMAALVFFQSSTDAGALSLHLDSKRVCHEIAAQISAVDAAGNGTVAALKLPLTVGGLNYSIFISASNRSISINYGEQGTACALSTNAVSNGTSGSFYITVNGSIATNNGGGIVVN
jgi:uncharacterized protein (UPF0333 family)